MKRNTLVSSVHFPSIAICTVGIAVLLALRRHLPKEEYTKKQYDSRTTTNRPLLVFVLVVFLGVLFVGIVCSLFYYYHAKPWMEKDKITKKHSKKPTISLEYKSINPQDVGDQLGKLLETLLLLTRETDQNTTNNKKKKEEEIGILEQEILKLFQILIQNCSDQRCQTKKRQSFNQRRKFPTLQDESSLELISQQAAFAVLHHYPYCDELISSCFTLLALIAKKESVRQRILQSHSSSTNSRSSTTNTTPFTTDSIEHVLLNNNKSSQLLLHDTSFSIVIPLHAMKESLCRAKKMKSSKQEQISSAEVQRKGCVFLGAIADGNSDVVVSIIQTNGLEVVFEALEWFRFHSNVANWSLWTLFIWTFHFPPTFPKLNLFFLISGNSTTNTNGLARICRVMKDIPNSMDVQRHGVAILFDVLREVVPSQNSTVIPMPPHMPIVVNIIRNAGVYSAVQSAMTNFPNCSEIQLMGTQIIEHLPIP